MGLGSTEPSPRSASARARFIQTRSSSPALLAITGSLASEGGRGIRACVGLGSVGAGTHTLGRSGGWPLGLGRGGGARAPRRQLLRVGEDQPIGERQSPSCLVRR